jgi:hypothetical protein
MRSTVRSVFGLGALLLLAHDLAAAESWPDSARVVEAWLSRIHAVVPEAGDLSFVSMTVGGRFGEQDRPWSKLPKEWPPSWIDRSDPGVVWAPDSVAVARLNCCIDADAVVFLTSLVDSLNTYFPNYGSSYRFVDVFWYDRHTLLVTTKFGGGPNLADELTGNLIDTRRRLVRGARFAYTGTIGQLDLEKQIKAYQTARIDAQRENRRPQRRW